MFLLTMKLMISQRSTNETSLSFLRQGNILSGTLSKGENVTLYFTGTPYKTDGSITIDGYLEVKANVTIQVKGGSSILVRHGTMVAFGTADMPIFFENLDTERWAGLNVEGVADLQHVCIREAGYGGLFGLTIKRPSSFVYKNIHIQEGMGNGVSIDGEGDYAFENLRIERSATEPIQTPTGIRILEDKVNLDIHGLFVSMSQPIYAISGRRLRRLSIKNAEIYSVGFTRLYLQADSFEVDNLVVMQMTASSQYQSSTVWLLTNNGTIANSIIGNGLSDTTLRAENGGYVKVHNVTFIETDIYINNMHSVNFENNNISGRRKKSTFLNVATRDFAATGNVVTNVTSNSHLWRIYAQNSIMLSSNVFDNCHSAGQASLIEIRSPDVGVKDNVLSNVTAHAIIVFHGIIDAIDFTRNEIIGPHVQFYVMTSSLYADLSGGTLKIGPNFWNTTSFEILDSGTFDSSYDPSLATIEFLSLFIDRQMDAIILAPPSQVLDEYKKRIGGIIANELVIVVPPGLYHASETIILRHPKAQLVIMAGVHITFAKYASIRVDQGTLKIMGQDGNSVLLTPTNAVEYDDTSIEKSFVFEGISFGPDSNGTLHGGNMEYIEGSIIRHCEVINGGYYQSSASLRLDGVSVMLDHVVIIGDWTRNVDGVYISRPSGPVVLRGVNVSGAGGSGVKVYDAGSTSSFIDVNIHGCHKTGLVIANSREIVITRSTFDGNSESHVNVWSSGSGEICYSFSKFVASFC
jgi:hypothetical protein